MSDSPQRQFPLQGMGATAALALLAVSNLVPDGSIPFRRGGEPQANVVEVSGRGTVPVRVWEDPLGVVNGVDPGVFIDNQEPAAVRLERSELAWDECPEMLLMVPVFLPGGGQSEYTEFRRRTRTAVSSAFSANGWTAAPELLPWVDGGRRLAVELLEWDSSSTSDRPFAKHAVVIWLDADSMGKDALAESARICSRIARVISDTCPAPDWLNLITGTELNARHSVHPDRIPFQIRGIGPYTSDQLIKMFNAEETQLPYTVEHARLYSPWATLDSQAILAAGRSSSQGESKVPRPNSEYDAEFQEEFLRKTGWMLERTTTTDLLLRKAIIDEVERRSHSKAGFKLHFLTEGSSAYGLAWKDLVKEARGEPAAAPDEANADRKSEDSGVIFGPGIDGSVPRVATHSSNGGKPGAVDEYARGKGQVDYLKRHALLQPRSTILDSKASPVSNYFGLFATEVPDKIALAYAARFGRSDAWLFLADLDARFLSPDHEAAMRNAIVASHFGLELCADLQGFVAPFRDAYQTATFFAALRVLERAEPLPADSKPLLFEIGHGRAVQLSSESGEQGVASVHPPAKQARALSFAKWRAGLILIALTFLLVFLAARTEIINLNSDAARGWMAWFLVILVTLALAQALLTFAVRGHNDGMEPLSWTLGVSVWPSEFLRLIAFMLGLGFLYALFLRYRSVVTDLDRAWPELAEPPGNADFGALAEQWHRFRETQIWRFLFRMGAGALVVLLMVSELRVFLGGGHPPVRGGAVANIDAVMRLLVKSMLMIQVVATSLLFRDIRWFFRAINDLKPAGALGLTHLEVTLTREDRAKSVRWVRLRAAILLEWSRRMYGVVYFPAIVLLFVVIARSSYFDRWIWSGTQLALLIACGLAVLFLAMSLRREARRLRGKILSEIGDCILLYHDAPRDLQVRKTLNDLAALRSELRDASSGALASTWNDPVLRALLVPISGLGAFELLYSGVLPV